MLTTNTTTLDYYKQNNRQIDVMIQSGNSTYLLPYKTLVNFSIERSVPKGKFFGYAVSQKITIEAIGSTIIKKYDILTITVGGLSQPKASLPRFFVDTVEYDSAKNTTTITGYDAIGYNGSMVFSDSSFTYPMTMLQFAQTMVSRIGYTLSADFSTGVNQTIEKKTLNLDGTETWKEVFAAIAEATGTICYCSSSNKIVFKTLPKATASNAGDSFDGSNYFNFSTAESVTLGKIASVTELGDNVEVGSGRTQILRENPFLVLRSNISSILNAIYQRVNGITITQHNLNFRGNPFYEIGDLLAVDTTKGVTKYIHYLGGTFTYNGGINDTSEWEDGEEENVKAAPTTIADAISQTYAKVDKVNKEITLVVSEVNNLQIGARNLLRNTDFSNANVLGNWTVWASGNTLNIVDGYMQVTNASGTTNFGAYGINKTTQLEAEQEYTLSFDAYADSELELDYCFLMSDDGNYSLVSALKPLLTEEVQHYKYTFTIPTAKTCSLMLGAYNVSDYTGSFYFKNLQLEKGNKATDWTPAPEDITDEVNDSISEIKLTTDGISATVSSLSDSTKSMIEANSDEIKRLSETQANMTAEGVSIIVKQELANGAVNSVTTTTGFTFDADGLTIDKSGSEMSTQITEDGMKVYRDNTAVLTANNVGVEATNLYATTFIILGETTRFEKYGSNRAGCFWIG